MSSALSGFWSYVHADDEAEGDRITLLAEKLVAEYEMITGEKIELFLDKDGIEWGEKWRDKIDVTPCVSRILHPSPDTKILSESKLP